MRLISEGRCEKASADFNLGSVEIFRKPAWCFHD